MYLDYAPTIIIIALIFAIITGVFVGLGINSYWTTTGVNREEIK